MEHTAEQLVEAGARLARAGLVAGLSGNLSVRRGDEILATPSGRPKGALGADELVRVTLEGASLDEPPRRVSSEIAVHLAIYRRAPWVEAVVHAHPVHATALTLQPGPINLCVTAEGAAGVGPVALVPYLRPGTEALAERCGEAAALGARAILLEHHGAVCLGGSMQEALARMESLEHVARLWAAARAMGHAPALPDGEVRALRRAYGLDDELPCEVFRLDQR